MNTCIKSNLSNTLAEMTKLCLPTFIIYGYELNNTSSRLKTQNNAKIRLLSGKQVLTNLQTNSYIFNATPKRSSSHIKYSKQIMSP